MEKKTFRDKAWDWDNVRKGNGKKTFRDKDWVLGQERTL